MFRFKLIEIWKYSGFRYPNTNSQFYLKNIYTTVPFVISIYRICRVIAVEQYFVGRSCDQDHCRLYKNTVSTVITWLFNWTLDNLNNKTFFWVIQQYIVEINQYLTHSTRAQIKITFFVVFPIMLNLFLTGFCFNARVRYKQTSTIQNMYNVMSIIT